ncbi:MAG: hypothetical protein J0M17_05965 [Planctomycetes bacterium]|nr:hypothetical protein [Planctomycetota bacterium]
MFSGKDGRVLVDSVPIADVVRWTLRTSARSVSYASNATGSARRTVPGNVTAAGSIVFHLSADAAPLAAGDVVELRLYLDAERFYEVPAVIEAVELETDVDTGALVGGTAQFAADGPWTAPTFS